MLPTDVIIAVVNMQCLLKHQMFWLFVLLFLIVIEKTFIDSHDVKKNIGVLFRDNVTSLGSKILKTGDHMVLNVTTQ
jgi:hypothetical protein